MMGFYIVVRISQYYQIISKISENQSRAKNKNKIYKFVCIIFWTISLWI